MSRSKEVRIQTQHPTPALRAPALAALAGAAALAACAAASAQEPPAWKPPATGSPAVTKEELAKDPAIRQSQDPEITPLGRNPPKPLEGQSSEAMQKGIDAAHEGSTGTTRPTDGRSPGDQPPPLRDGSAPRQTVPPQ